MDLTEEQLQSEFGEMLEKSGKLPEVILVLKASEDNIINRLFNQNEIEAEYNKLMQERKLKKDKQRAERK